MSSTFSLVTGSERLTLSDIPAFIWSFTALSFVWVMAEMVDDIATGVVSEGMECTGRNWLESFISYYSLRSHPCRGWNT